MSTFFSSELSTALKFDQTFDDKTFDGTENCLCKMQGEDYVFH